MRTQRRPPLTVTLVTVTTTRDELGNSTETSSRTTVDGAGFEPERTLERVDNDQVPIVQPAVFNIPGVYTLNADDRIEHDGTIWQVVGGSMVWRDRTKVPVVRTGSV